MFQAIIFATVAVPTLTLVRLWTDCAFRQTVLLKAHVITHMLTSTITLRQPGKLVTHTHHSTNMQYNKKL